MCFTDLDGNQTLAANNHAARHNKVHREVEAIAQRVGKTGDTDPNSHEKKIADLQNDKADITYVDGEVADLEALLASTVSAAVAATKEALYPVGSLYYNATDGTDPAILLGFGTWSAYAAGRVPVGIDPLDSDFSTAGNTGGEKTHTLTTNEMPSHWHTVVSRMDQTTGANLGSPFGISRIWPAGGNNYQITATGTQTANATQLNTEAPGALPTGGGASHNNLQPYVALYIWQRTA